MGFLGNIFGKSGDKQIKVGQEYKLYKRLNCIEVFLDDKSLTKIPFDQTYIVCIGNQFFGNNNMFYFKECDSIIDNSSAFLTHYENGYRVITSSWEPGDNSVLGERIVLGEKVNINFLNNKQCYVKHENGIVSVIAADNGNYTEVINTPILNVNAKDLDHGKWFLSTVIAKIEEGVSFTDVQPCPGISSVIKGQWQWDDANKCWIKL